MLASTLSSVDWSWAARSVAWFSEAVRLFRVDWAWDFCCSSDDWVAASWVCAVCRWSIVDVTLPVAIDEYSDRMPLVFTFGGEELGRRVRRAGAGVVGERLGAELALRHRHRVLVLGHLGLAGGDLALELGQLVVGLVDLAGQATAIWAWVAFSLAEMAAGLGLGIGDLVRRGRRGDGHHHRGGSEEGGHGERRDDPVAGPVAACGAGTWLDRRVLLGVSHMRADGSRSARWATRTPRHPRP